MAKLVAAVCPVCRVTAKKAAATGGDFSEFRCARCGDFRASGACLVMLPHHPPARRRHALMQAKLRAGYGATPMITSYDLP